MSSVVSSMCWLGLPGIWNFVFGLESPQHALNGTTGSVRVSFKTGFGKPVFLRGISSSERGGGRVYPAIPSARNRCNSRPLTFQRNFPRHDLGTDLLWILGLVVRNAGQNR